MRVGHCAPNARRIPAPQLATDESGLGRSNIIECLRHSQDGCRNCDARRQPSSYVAGEESRLLTASLFKSGEEEGAIFNNGPAEGSAILRAREGRICDRRERVSRLEASVAQKSKDVTLIGVGARLSDYVDNSASCAAKFRCIRVSGYLKFLHGLLRHCAA